jgi:hypothetical protein
VEKVETGEWKMENGKWKKENAGNMRIEMSEVREFERN